MSDDPHDHLEDEEIRELLRRHLPRGDRREPAAGEVRQWVADELEKIDDVDDLLIVYQIANLLASQPLPDLGQVEETFFEVLRRIARGLPR